MQTWRLKKEELKVLLVEDSPDDAFFIRRAFREAGVPQPPHVCENVFQAIDYLQGKPPFDDRERHPFPHIIITDLKMPGKSGLEFLEWLREHPELQVVPTCVLSSSAQEVDVKAAYCVGANCYLQKPTRYDDLARVVDTLLQHWSDCEVPQHPNGEDCALAIQEAERRARGG
jgi:CheY-like chemotaxis protein